MKENSSCRGEAHVACRLACTGECMQICTKWNKRIQELSSWACMYTHTTHKDQRNKQHEKGRLLKVKLVWQHNWQGCLQAKARARVRIPLIAPTQQRRPEQTLQSPAPTVQHSGSVATCVATASMHVCMCNNTSSYNSTQLHTQHTTQLINKVCKK